MTQSTGAGTGAKSSSGLSELWRKEDWWAIWIGVAIVLASIGLFESGASLRWLAIAPPKWSSFSQVTADLATNWLRYAAQFLFWLAALSLALRQLSVSVRRFAPSFALVYLATYVIFVVGQWASASAYNLEPPLIALFSGLVIANLVRVPAWLEAGFRGELFVKTGIVLLGATVPLSLIALAGPTAILQASIVSLVTFGVIYVIARKLGLERPFAAMLGVGGAVCGVSAAIAVAGAVGAKKEDTAVTISTVVLWAIVMIFVLPFAARALHLPTGVAGAWIGTSEFADAAGIAAAQAYGGFAGHGIAGTPDQAVQAFTLVKVVGRDVWIGIWAVALAIISTTRWESNPAGNGPDAREIWRRFPKFVLGFFLTSAIVTLATASYSLADYNKIATPGFIAPVKDLRTWCFTFCFLSIGLTTRFRSLAATGPRPLIAFTAGVFVNVIVGYILSAHVFAAHWERLGQ